MVIKSLNYEVATDEALEAILEDYHFTLQQDNAIIKFIKDQDLEDRVFEDNQDLLADKFRNKVERERYEFNSMENELGSIYDGRN